MIWLGTEGQIYFTHDGMMYFDANLGYTEKYNIGSEKVTEIEKWLNENCEYTDEKKNAESLAMLILVRTL